MPIYNYRCQSCNADVEILVRSGSKPECPECGSKKLTRQLSVPAKCHTESHSCCGKSEQCEHHNHGGCCHSGGCCCGH